MNQKEEFQGFMVGLSFIHMTQKPFLIG